MALVRWSQQHDLPTFPSDVLNMQREINRMFDSFFRSGWVEDTGLAPAAWSPATDIVENDNGYIVKVELPGMSKDEVKITMQNNVLTVRGEKKRDKEGKENGYHRIERSYGAFQRCFTLPAAVDASTIDASFKDGILTLTLPRTEATKPKTIEVKAR
jgi:HSP20 family protein